VRKTIIITNMMKTTRNLRNAEALAPELWILFGYSSQVFGQVLPILNGRTRRIDQWQ
jgi:hypothetical protein